MYSSSSGGWFLHPALSSALSRSSPCPGPTVEPECPRPLLRLEGCLWGRLSLLAPRPSTEGYPQPTLAPLYFSPAPLAPNWASRTVTFRDHPASPATHTGNSPRDHDGHTAPGPTVVWLRAWPQRKGWKVGEVAVCSSRRDGGGGWVVLWPPGGSHSPLTRLQEAGSLGHAGLGKGGQQTPERRKLPC